ncbi:MAG: DUF3575 domain-containing protein [Bacteroidales bacterium]|nr:DUF3575 domain-containing protein [Bacteroidales bacterium]
MRPLLTTLIALMAGLIPALAQPIGSSAETSPPTVVIWFGFDDATVRPDFSDNRHSLAQLDSLLHERNFTLLDTLRIVGKSSMDGVYAYNAQLATRRARAVRSYILKHYPDFQGTLSVLSEGEVWAEFREAVAQDSSLPEGTRERMLGIIDSDASPDRKEARLKSLPTWRSYMRALFPTYRSATVTPYYWMLDLPRLPEDEMLESLSWLPRTPAVQLRPDLLTVPALTPVRKRAKGPIRPVFGLSTNLLYDLTYIPNYGLTSIPSFSLEYYPARSRHLTLGTDVEWPMWKHWEDHRFLQIQNVTLWMRRYFKSCDERFHGMYLFASANAARFGIGYDAKGWEGEGVGASLGIGCKWTLGRRLFLDLGIAGGAFYAQYDPYVYGNDATHRYYYDYTGAPEEFVVRNHRWLWGGPTRAYLSLGIDLFNRKRRSR